MIRTMSPSTALPISTRPVVLRVVRQVGSATIPRQNPQRPAWSLLYAIVPLALAGLWVIEVLLPVGHVRTAAELLATLGCIALTRLWIAWNRWSLVHTDAQDHPGLQVQAADAPSARGAAS